MAIVQIYEGRNDSGGATFLLRLPEICFSALPPTLQEAYESSEFTEIDLDLETVDPLSRYDKKILADLNLKGWSAWSQPKMSVESHGRKKA